LPWLGGKHALVITGTEVGFVMEMMGGARGASHEAGRGTDE